MDPANVSLHLRLRHILCVPVVFLAPLHLCMHEALYDARGGGGIL